MSDKTLSEQSEDLTGHNGGSRRVGSEKEHKALTVPRSIFTITENQLGRMKILAQMVSASSFTYGKLSEADAFLIMIKGMEIGLEPMAALASINIIQGLPTLSPQGMLALINRTGELVDLVIVGDEKQCRVTMSRAERTPHTEVFTLDDAKSQGLTGKSNWQKMTAIMLKWRAVAACARVVFPDVIQGLYTQEEIGADVEYTDDGSVIAEVPALPEKSKTPTPPPPVETPDEPTVKYDLTAVVEGAAFMYDHPAHAANSIAKMVEVGEIEPVFSTNAAIAKVMLHRAESQPYAMPVQKVCEALTVAMEAEGSAVPIASVSQWVSSGKTIAQAWDAVKTYHENNGLKPAKAKKQAAQAELIPPSGHEIPYE